VGRSLFTLDPLSVRAGDFFAACHNSLFTKQGCSGILKKEMLEKSYRLVLMGFSKKKQRELLERAKSNAV
jgi:hypothetical protein